MFDDSGISHSEFQSQYWRAHPCQLGQVDLLLLNDLSFADILELAQDPDVESRMIRDNGSGYSITPEVSQELPQGAMAMVQNLESFSYQVSGWLAEQFGFLPRWRVEDVMATLAHAGGNCGPHFDQYDVFLVQLSGEKTWYLDEGGHSDEDLMEASDIRLLANFEATSSFVQKPGDVLYIPPGYGHHGIASDNCITLSVGIRNPIMAEMASHLADLLLQEQDTSSSLSDELMGAEINPVEVARLGDKLTAAMTQNNLLSVWYGSYMTLPRDSELIAEPDFSEDITIWRQQNPMVYLDLPARIAYQTSWLFVNGEALALDNPAPWLLELQQQREIATERVPESDNHLLLALIEASAVIPYPDD